MRHSKYISDPLTWFSIAAGCASIYFAIQEDLWFTFSILSALCLVLITYLVTIYRHYKKAKPYRNSRGDFHLLVHRMRDACSALVDEDSEDKSEQIIHAAIREILDNASRIFSEITGYRCTASLMLRTEDGMCETKMYSSNVEPDRETNPSKKIPVADGYVGRAFRYKKIQCWSGGNCGTFTPIRENYSEYYRSGMSIPVNANGVPHGILNIDSKQENMFSLEHKDIAAMLGDALALILEMSELWYTGVGVELNGGETA